MMRKKLAALSLLACASACTATQQPATRGAEYYLQEGETYFEKELYDEAISAWEKVRESYYSPELNILAELKIAEAYFLAGRYPEAAAAYEDFLKQHPDHPRTPEVLYQLGMSYYEQILSADRDQTATRNALATFEALLEKYPENPRAEEVGFLIRRCKDRLAAHELYVGRFYLRTDNYEAAIMRFNDLFARFPNYFYRDEAYFYLGRAYIETGLKEKAVETFNTLYREFPKSEFVLKAQKLMADRY